MPPVECHGFHQDAMAHPTTESQTLVGAVPFRVVVLLGVAFVVPPILVDVDEPPIHFAVFGKVGTQEGGLEEHVCGRPWLLCW